VCDRLPALLDDHLTFLKQVERLAGRTLVDDRGAARIVLNAQQCGDLGALQRQKMAKYRHAAKRTFDHPLAVDCAQCGRQLRRAPQQAAQPFAPHLKHVAG
jgi:hypothetical protein